LSNLQSQSCFKAIINKRLLVVKSLKKLTFFYIKKKHSNQKKKGDNIKHHLQTKKKELRNLDSQTPFLKQINYKKQVVLFSVFTNQENQIFTLKSFKKSIKLIKKPL
jgi:hypothetical protein